MMREVSPRSAAGSETVTEAAMWMHSSSWVIVRAARGGGIAPAMQIPVSVLALTIHIVGTSMSGSAGPP